MFIPIESDTIKKIKNLGDIQFHIFRGWEQMAIKKTYRLVPFKIVYANRLTKHNTNLFICTLSMGNTIVIIDDLEIYKKTEPPTFLSSHKPRYKALVHFYLGLAIDEAISMTKEHHKDKIMIRSSLPGIADVLFERNFIVKTGYALKNEATAEAFKGLKKL